jgi:hypothetical protein
MEDTLWVPVVPGRLGGFAETQFNCQYLRGFGGRKKPGFQLNWLVYRPMPPGAAGVVVGGTARGL